MVPSKWENDPWRLWMVSMVLWITWELLGSTDDRRCQGLFGCNRVLAATQRSMGRKTQPNTAAAEAHPGTLIATDASTVAAWSCLRSGSKINIVQQYKWIKTWLGSSQFHLVLIRSQFNNGAKHLQTSAVPPAVTWPCRMPRPFCDKRSTMSSRQTFGKCWTCRGIAICWCDTYLYIYMSVYYIYSSIYKHTYVPTYIRTYVHTYLRTYVHTYIHCIRTYVHTYIHTYIHT